MLASKLLTLPVQSFQIMLHTGQAVASAQLGEQDCALPVLAHEGTHQITAVAPKASR